MGLVKVSKSLFTQVLFYNYVCTAALLIAVSTVILRKVKGYKLTVFQITFSLNSSTERIFELSNIFISIK